MTDKRIISLSPAATEIICALGLEKQLVGRSQECGYLEKIKDLPVFASIELDVDLIHQLAPDVVFVDDHYINAVKEVNLNAISLNFATLSDVFTSISAIGEALNANEKVEELIENLRERVDIVLHKLKFSEIKPKTACITQLSPLVIGENLMSDMISIAGGSTLSISNIGSTGVNLEEFKLEDPQIIIIMPENYTIQRTLQEINLLLNVPGWSDLSAVKNNQVYIADGQNYFASQGIKVIDRMEILAEIIHPKQFVFGFEGNGWNKFNI
ncbi:MAG: cobalamin-binding protein [Sphingobacteriales bacterium]|nr:cobalamin-binding protein [Sphingobacteriales bacterium]